MNQCDGCRGGFPVDERGMHKWPDGVTFMACEKSKYEQEEEKLPGRTYWAVYVYAKSLEDIQKLNAFIKDNFDRYDVEEAEEFNMRKGDPFSEDKS